MAAQPEPGALLEDVFGTQEETEAQVVCGLLESAGIDAMVIPLQAPQDILPGVGGMRVRVRAEDAQRARQVIEEYRTADTLAEEDVEISEEPPSGQ